jgi:dTDP-4-dehydrorhamnose 3,5-epimerase
MFWDSRVKSSTRRGCASVGTAVPAGIERATGPWHVTPMQNDSHSSLGQERLEDTEGFVDAVAKESLTTSEGQLRVRPIDGLKFRPALPVSHHHGYLTEAFRADWNLTEEPIVQVNSTTTFPGRIRAWGIHRLTVDRLFAATGSLCIVCFDGRRKSPTFGYVNEFIIGGKNQGLVVIPPGIFHGWKNIGADEATIISMPSQLYNHEGPDRWELPWDSPTAQKVIPYRWP